MDDNDRKVLRKQRADLVEFMEVNELFLSQLVSEEIFTEDDVDDIKGLPTRQKQVSGVISKLHLKRDGLRGIVSALRRSNQRDLADGLEASLNRQDSGPPTPAGAYRRQDSQPSASTSPGSSQRVVEERLSRMSLKGDKACLLCMGGRNEEQKAIASTECCDIDTRDWSNLEDLPRGRHSFAAVVCNGNLYAIGGHDGEERLASGDVLKQGEWSKISAMSTVRMDLAAAELDGHIYALAGSSSAKPISSAERYDTRTNEWSSIAPLPAPIYSAAAASLRGRVFFTGGTPDSPKALDGCLRYDPNTDRWTSRQPMSNPRWGHGAAAASGAVYVAGGEAPVFPCPQASSAEFYDDRENKWHGLPRMKVARSGCGVATDGSNIYVAGGFNKDDRCVSSVEAFDIKANKWRFLPDLNTDRNWTQLVFIPASR